MDGSDVDLAAAVLDCAGVKHEMFLGGWSGLLPATAGGQVDIFWDNLYYTPERAKQLDFVVYMQAETGAMAQAGNPKKITGLDFSSCGMTYASGLGTVEEVAARKQDGVCKAAGKPGITVMTYPDLASGIRLLQSGRGGHPDDGPGHGRFPGCEQSEALHARLQNSDRVRHRRGGSRRAMPIC